MGLTAAKYLGGLKVWLKFSMNLVFPSTINTNHRKKKKMLTQILCVRRCLVVLGPSQLFGEPSQAELFDKASRAKPRFFQKRRTKPSFLLSKPSQTELSVL